MKINKIKISGGNQQFGENIYNSNQPTDNIDLKLLKLIKDEVPNIEERKILLQDLQEVKNDPEKSVDSKSRLSSFLDNLTNEGAKQIARELIDSGSELINFIIN